MARKPGAARIRAGFLIASVLVPLPAGAAPGTPEGRWQGQAHQPMTLDITRCAQGWCGVLVEADGRCGPRALTVPGIASLGPTTEGEATGRLVLPGHPRPYAAQLVMTRTREGSPQLMLQGVEEGLRHPFARRIFPVQAFMARIGDARCMTPVS